MLDEHRRRDLKRNIEVIGTKEANPTLLAPRSVHGADGETIRVRTEEEIQDAVEEAA